jgi:hypothetical protein
METVRFLPESKQSDPLPERGLSILIISFKGVIDAKKNFNSTLRDCIAAGERCFWLVITTTQPIDCQPSFL